MYVYYITVFILIFKCLLGNIVYCFKIFYVNYKNNELWYNKKCAIIYHFYVLLPGSKCSYLHFYQNIFSTQICIICYILLLNNYVNILEISKCNLYFSTFIFNNP